jgi:hypothetical protein
LNPEVVVTLARRLATAGLQLAAVMMTRIRITQCSTREKNTLYRCTSAELLFSCCDSAAALWQQFWQHDQLLSTNNERRRGQRPEHHAQLPARRRGQRPGATTKDLRRRMSAAAGNGLGTTSNEHSPAMYNERRRG